MATRRGPLGAGLRAVDAHSHYLFQDALSEADKVAILGGNAMKLFGLPA